MGLIERTVDGATGEDSLVEPPLDTGAGRPFALNPVQLRARGVFAPGDTGSSQALELRAIKRRLLRRIGFLQRAGRTTRQLRAAGRARNLVLVTSTRPGEGKTFAAVNLAVSLASEERVPVTLIDADVLRPRVRSYFDLPPSGGLVDRILDPTTAIADIAWRAEGLPLTVIGEGRRLDSATDLFASAAAQRFFSAISACRPDGVVIVDAPPILAATETIALARHADEICFVVEADETPQASISAALDELLELNPNVSLLLNRCLIAGGGAHYGAYEYYQKRGAGEAGAAEGDLQ